MYLILFMVFYCVNYMRHLFQLIDNLVLFGMAVYIRLITCSALLLIPNTHKREEEKGVRPPSQEER